MMVVDMMISSKELIVSCWRNGRNGELLEQKGAGCGQRGDVVWLGRGLTQSEPSKASSSGSVRSKEGLLVLFSIVLPRTKLAGALGVLSYPSTCEAGTEGVELGSVFWRWGLCVQPLGTEPGCKQRSLPAGDSLTSLEGDLFFLFPSSQCCQAEGKVMRRIGGGRQGGRELCL